MDLALGGTLHSRPGQLSTLYRLYLVESGTEPILEIIGLLFMLLRLSFLTTTSALGRTLHPRQRCWLVHNCVVWGYAVTLRCLWVVG